VTFMSRMFMSGVLMLAVHLVLVSGAALRLKLILALVAAKVMNLPVPPQCHGFALVYLHPTNRVFDFRRHDIPLLSVDNSSDSLRE
jgi:hypothetical protein